MAELAELAELVELAELGGGEVIVHDTHKCSKT